MAPLSQPAFSHHLRRFVSLDHLTVGAELLQH